MKLEGRGGVFGENTYETQCVTLTAEACPAGDQGAALLRLSVRATLRGLSRLAFSTHRESRRPEAAFPSLLCIFPELPPLPITGSHSRGINIRRRLLLHRYQLGVKRTGGGHVKGAPTFTPPSEELGKLPTPHPRYREI